ncbi:restriction endonuclease [Xenococcus sp. PCC 7305]|uniref:HNH endonuclease n=1 Tax=Xenococcus sp. PCC 7305 TaxID=102125 RepID=UPI0002AC7941|nr:HNH endonuclease signature motif containing protein [Xenococcus sp. PCC 7305]ELS02125.1 restriction endonuclease [Xenococcus sp. PCC 7305]
MSTTYIPVAVRRLVEKRAHYQCEYCLIPANLSFFPHEIDHIIAEKHGGKTEANNLAYTCWRCNRYKGTDLGSFDPQTSDFSFLFNPRIQQWIKHFAVEHFQILGLTSVGRTTAKLLQFNNDERIAERERL